jgi:hypothetical protein
LRMLLMLALALALAWARRTSSFKLSGES